MVTRSNRRLRPISLGGQTTTVVTVAPTLQPLILSAASIIENSAAGTIVGTILGTTTGSTLSLSDSAGGRFAIAGGAIVAGPTNIDYDSSTGGAASYSITILETLPGATGSPKPTTLAIAVINQNDTNPNAFSFSPVTGVPTATTETSNTITVAGMSASDTANVSVSGDSTSKIVKNGVVFLTPTTTAVDGDMVAVQHTSSSLPGTQVSTTLTIGNKSSTFTSTTAAVGLAQPTVTNSSALGATPVVLQLTSTGGTPAGCFLQWEFAGSLTPPKNGDGSYSTTTQKDVKFVDGDSWARLDLALGYNTPSGPFAFHCRALVNDDAGAITLTDSLGETATYTALTNWSNDYTDTISTSVAVWSSASTDRSQYITADTTLQLHVNNNLGASCGNRATISASGKKHFELRVDELRAGGVSDIHVGVTDASTDLGLTNHPLPGNSTAPGFTCKINGTTNTVAFFYNGSAQGTAALPAAAAIGDAFIVEFDTATAGVVIKWFRAADSSVTTLNSFTMTSNIPAAYYGYGGGFYGTTSGATDSDKFTANFGASAFLVTPTTGYTYYG